MAENEPRDGQAVDRSGGPAIDPTANVLSLVDVEKQHARELRAADTEILGAKIETLRAEQRVLQATTDGQANLQNWMRDSESKRLDQLSGLRETYEKRIADMLSESVRSTSALVSTQLLQIQSTFDARVSKLEEFRLLSTGRSSVADPALAEALTAMATNISTLKETGSASTGRGVGRGDVIGWIAGGLGLLAALLTAVYTMHPAGVQPTTSYVPAPTTAPAPAPVTVPR